ncbi:MAG TPA: glycoside hydrolase family 15 [Candidatus Vogelbacteria bacterium]|nr:glycoside hydrolase family 15 [Candidatus Vogelbacteria bacterium]
MARALTLGNGSILVGIDHFGQVRDFYYPHVGLENHVGGHFVHRVGVFSPNPAVGGTGKLAWLSDPSWRVSVGSKEESLSSDIRAENRDLGVSLAANDLVYNEHNIFIRKVTVKNLQGVSRPIKIFFAHQFEITESHRAHTAYYDPAAHAIIHYRGRRVFLINAKLEGRGFDDYSTGVFDSEGKEGTHKDAEDGTLAKNPIEHGLADSVIGLSGDFGPGEEKTVYYWVAVGKTHDYVKRLNTMVEEKSPAHMIKTTEDYWRAWINRQNFNFHGLTPEVVALFKKSLFIIRAHTDHGGAIIASSDSSMMQQGGKDNYCYMWHRDGAFSSMALDRAGDFTVCQRFFEFSNAVIGEEGYFLHKYSPDRSLGSSWHGWVDKITHEPRLPIQEDETALTIIALWRHYELTKDLEFIELLYNSLIRRAADFMVSYRDEKTGLPLPSNDLWEENFGTHTFTAASVYGALSAASHFAELLGKTKSQTRFTETARQIKEAILAHLYDETGGYFCKSLGDKTVDASSALGIFAFGVLPIDDLRLIRAMKKTEEDLTVKTSIGGIARYQGDQYYRSNAGLPGNPWIVTTLWLAEYLIVAAENDRDLDRARSIFSWVVSRADRSGALPEQVHPFTGAPLSASPLVWSHAAFVHAIVSYLDRLETLGICKARDQLNNF